VLFALAFFALHFFCARQWIYGRPIWHIALYALLACSATAYAALRPAERTRQAAIWASAANLKSQAAALETNARIYAPGLDESLILFYTGLKPKKLRDLPDETNPGPVVLIAQGDSLQKTAKAYGIEFNALATEISDGFSLIVLPPNSENEIKLRNAVRDKRK
jgi:hypothetical protein